MHLLTVIIISKAVQSKEGYFFRKKIYFLIYTVILVQPGSTGKSTRLNKIWVVTHFLFNRVEIQGYNPSGLQLPVINPK
jgi:hypothetical protein